MRFSCPCIDIGYLNVINRFQDGLVRRMYLNQDYGLVIFKFCNNMSQVIFKPEPTMTLETIGDHHET